MKDPTNEASPPEPEMSTLDKARSGVWQSLNSMKTLLHAVKAPLPTQTGDGTYLPQEEKATTAWKEISDIIRDIPRQDINDLEGLLKTFASAKLERPLDDKQYLMESVIAVAAKMPDSKLQQKITNQLITTLWDDLEHPPKTLLSDQYEFRQPDGSHNSYQNPDVGKAGTPYARTVAPKVKQAGVLPDPGILFDSLLARKNPKGEKHPNRISSMLFYLASIIIHDVFRTDHADYNISNTSSYLDLSPLYGSTWEEQKQMRTFKDGKIKADCFSETRILSFPPGVGALLIMFNRYHNYVVEQLAAINEDGRFSEDPRKPTVQRYGEEKPLNKRDDDLFQTARLIVCGLYVNMILIDYVRTILNLNRTDDNWQLNPRAEIPNGPLVATGNQCAVEFNLVYRWHAAISERDDLWTQQLFKELYPDISAEDVSKPENVGRFLATLAKMESKTKSQDPAERAFPALQKDKMDRVQEGPYKGNYKDDELMELLASSVEDCANAMGPRQVPIVMKAVEMLGIQQARTWRCATLNEMRKHFDLKPHETFASISEDVEVQQALKHLYDTPDQVELYPGLVVEDAKDPKLPGSGLCPSYTTSRGVLSDAVALVRGDRFHTSAYTPALLTNWGFQESSSDITIDNGCVFYKLFLRALPNSFDPMSTYVHYPMTVPDEMHTILKGLGKDHLYTFDRPRQTSHPVVLFSAAAVKQAAEDQDAFHVTWGPAMEYLMGPKAANFMLAGDGPANAASRTMMEKALYQTSQVNVARSLPAGNEAWLRAVRDYYEHKTTELLRAKSYTLAGTRYVDIIRDVGNMAHVHFGAELFSIPLKTAEFPRGLFTEQQLYLIMAAVFVAVFFDLDPPKSFPLRIKARAACQQLGKIMALQVESIKRTGWLAESLIDAIKPNDSSHLKDYGVHMLTQLVKAHPSLSVDELVWGHIMGTVGGMIPNQGQLFAQVLDYFFTDGAAHLPELHRLATLDTPDADDRLMHYFMEAARLAGETGAFRHATRDITVTDTVQLPGKAAGGASSKTFRHDLRRGDVVMLNFKAASRDPAAFPDPDTFDPTRPLDAYLTLGHGAHQCLGLPMTRVALTTMLKVVGRLDGLRAMPVSVGRASVPHSVKKVVREFAPGDSDVKEGGIPESWHYHVYLTEDWDQYFPFPTTLKIAFDGEIPDAKPSRT